MTFYHHRTCASPILPFRESLPALLSFLPDETRLGLLGVAAQSCGIICGQLRSHKVGLAQSPEVHGHADGWGSLLQGQRVAPAILEHCRGGTQVGKNVLDVFQLWVCLSHHPSEGWGGGERLEDEGKCPEITWISASLSLMMLQMSVHLGGRMKQI